MDVKETGLEGVLLVTPQLFRDERGYFTELFQTERFRQAGLEHRVAQVNLPQNVTRGTLRGLHMQVAPMAQTKLVSCLRGRIFDVAVDVRPGSPTFGRWTGAELDPEERGMLYIPHGFAHGYQAMEDGTEVQYLTFELWSPDHERGFRWDDPAFGIDWPVADPILSPKDAAYPLMER